MLGPVGRENARQLAEHAGHGSPASYAAVRLGEDDGVLITDETGYLKKGTMSAGV